MKTILSILFATAALIGVGVAASAQSSGSRGGVLVAGAMRSAHSMLLPATKLAAKAATAKPGSARWFSLMDRARCEHRLAVRHLSKFRRVTASPELKTRYDRMRSEAVARAIRVYQSIIAQHVAVGNRRTAVRLRNELSRFAPEAAARVPLEVVSPARVDKRASRSAGDERVTNPRAGSGRRTGAELRWLGRRGYRPGRAARG